MTILLQYFGVVVRFEVAEEVEESSSWSPESVDKRQVDAAEVVGGNTDFYNGEIDE